MGHASGITTGHICTARGGRHTTGGHLRAPGKRATRGAVTRGGGKGVTMEAEAKHPLIWRKRKTRKRRYTGREKDGSAGRGRDASKDPSR